MRLLSWIAQALLVVGGIVLALVLWSLIGNRARLGDLAERFCSYELPPETEQARCHSAMGVLTPFGAEHCDYVVWMKIYTDLTEQEILTYYEDKSFVGTDGSTMLATEVYLGTVVPPGTRARKFHVQLTDIGHPAGFDPQCRSYGVE